MLDYMRGYMIGYRLKNPGKVLGKSNKYINGYVDGHLDKSTGHRPLYPKWHYLWLPLTNIAILLGVLCLLKTI